MDEVTNTESTEFEPSLKNKLSLKKENLYHLKVRTGLKGGFIMKDTIIIRTGGFVGQVTHTNY